MEKSQDEIKFENLYSNSLGGFWSHYQYESMGNVIHWLYTYTNLDIAEQATIGGGEVHYRGELLARFTFNPKLEMPIFYEINDKLYPYFSENQERYITGLTRFPAFVEKMTQLKEQFKEHLTNGRKK